MANNLGRDIESGEIVVLTKDAFKKEYQDLSYRLFVCNGGFGMQGHTMGNAVFGEFLSDGEQCRYEGYDIDKKETEKFRELLASFDTV